MHWTIHLKHILLDFKFQKFKVYRKLFLQNIWNIVTFETTKGLGQTSFSIEVFMLDIIQNLCQKFKCVIF